MKLYFKHSDGTTTLLSEYETFKESFAAINQFLSDHNYRSYYTRVSGSDDEIWIDVGSHTEFFIIKGASFEDYKNMQDRKELI